VRNLALLVVLTGLLLCLDQAWVGLNTSLCLCRLNMLRSRCRVPRRDGDVILGRRCGASRCNINLVLWWCCRLAWRNIDLVLWYRRW
jgi:hypothetical protein